MAGLHILSPSFLFLGLSFAELLKVQIDEAEVDGPTDRQTLLMLLLLPLPQNSRGRSLASQRRR